MQSRQNISEQYGKKELNKVGEVLWKENTRRRGIKDGYNKNPFGTKGVKPTEAHMRTNTHPTDKPTEAPTPHKKVSWRDTLFPRRTLVDMDS